MRIKKLLGIALVVTLVLSLSGSAKAGVSSYKKDTSTVKLRVGKWTDVPFDGSNSFTLNGDRTLWGAQLHMRCDKAPKYIKMRFARHLPDGKLDTTGTNTWMTNKKFPNKSWQGSLLWETKSEYPMTVQYKIIGGKNCYSDSRQFKWWQPGEPIPVE